MNFHSTKRPGNILSAFNSDLKLDFADKFVKLKKDLLHHIGQPGLNDSWNRLLQQFEVETKLIQELGPNAVPKVEFEELVKNGGKFPSEVEAEVRKRGCVVIKNVVDKDVALKYKEDIKKYIANHPGEIVGFPEDNPQGWELYWSKAQVQARSHPNFVLAAKAMNELWHADSQTPIDFSTNLAYCDRLRIRKKGDSSFTLKEHIDGGSVERWEDPEYRKCYTKILNGNWEDYDPYDATHRITANMDLYDCSGGCSMFRTFQGWMSLSHVKPGEGTLRVCPLIKLSTAYLILRPLLKDLIETQEMGGATPGAQQHILPDIHPHIVNCVVSIPEVAPGDCVFWHCDGVHAVEGVCNSPDDSSVLYIPATPLCPKNADYLLRQRYAFENGLTPPDFPLNNCEKDFNDRATPQDLTELGRQVMGFSKFSLDDKSVINEGVKAAVNYANKTLSNDLE